MQRDNKLWLAHLNSEGEAQQQAISDLRQILINSLRGKMWNGALIDDAFLEDAVQDSIIRILNRLHQFEGRSKFLTWAISISIHIAISELRRRKWKDVSLEELISDTGLIPGAIMDTFPEPGVSREKEVIIKIMYDLIKNSLTEKQSVALLAELKEMPQDEIARYIGSNRNAVYKLTHDARKQLKKGLENVGYKVTDIQAIFAN